MLSRKLWHALDRSASLCPIVTTRKHGAIAVESPTFGVSWGHHAESLELSHCINLAVLADKKEQLRKAKDINWNDGLIWWSQTLYPTFDTQKLSVFGELQSPNFAVFLQYRSEVFAIVGVFANSIEDGAVLHYCLPSNLGCIAASNSTRITMYHHYIEQLGGNQASINMQFIAMQ